MEMEMEPPPRRLQTLLLKASQTLEVKRGLEANQMWRKRESLYGYILQSHRKRSRNTLWIHSHRNRNWISPWKWNSPMKPWRCINPPWIPAATPFHTLSWILADCYLQLSDNKHFSPDSEQTFCKRTFETVFRSWKVLMNGLIDKSWGEFLEARVGFKLRWYFEE